MYDTTGSLSSESLAGEDFNNLYDYYRKLYREVTEDDIDDFAAEFRGSSDEAAEVLKYYERFKGNMDQVKCLLGRALLVSRA